MQFYLSLTSLFILFLANEIPTLSLFGNQVLLDNDRYYLTVTANESVEFIANGTDDGNITYHLVQNSANATIGERLEDGTVSVTVMIRESQPVNIR